MQDYPCEGLCRVYGSLTFLRHEHVQGCAGINPAAPELLQHAQRRVPGQCFGLPVIGGEGRACTFNSSSQSKHCLCTNMCLEITFL